MGERGRSLDSGHNRRSDSDKSSNSCYSDSDSSRSSDRSPTSSTQFTNTGEKNKTQHLKSLAHYQATKQIASKYAPNKRGSHWGFRSQSLNRDSSAKDISCVTKRVLSARLLKINELRNELTELHVKLDELQKENRALKRLQYRQEKALHKFEDTENEISKLLAQHNDETRILRERLRKSQEKEQSTERKLRTSEEELYKVKSSLQKLRRLAEDRHLPERDELARKLALAENRLDDSEKRIKDLERNLELSNSSFQRQIHSEKKKFYDTQEENKVLQEEVQRLTQKLKEKEKELDAKNIYSNRMSKVSPKKDADVIPRKKGVNKNTKKEIQITKGVQTTGYFSPEFPLPPDFIIDDIPGEKEDDTHLGMEQAVKNDWNEQAEYLQQEQNREREERLKSDQELQVLEERAKKLRDEWEKEESERKKKDYLLLEKEAKEKLGTEIHNLGSGPQNNESAEVEKQKEILLAKMHEIDRETQLSIRAVSQDYTSNTVTIPYSLEKNKRRSGTVEKLFNGFQEYDQFSSLTKGEAQKQQVTQTTYSDLTFGSYVPSFGKVSGRPSWVNQKSDFLDEFPKENVNFDTKRDRKPNLMEQLFGSNTNTTSPSKGDDLDTFGQDSGTNSGFQDKGMIVKDESDLFFGETKSVNSKRHRLQHTASKPAVKALDYLEDEIEEVLLQ